MKSLKKSLLAITFSAIVVASAFALAAGNELAYFKVSELETLTGASVASGDYIPVLDVSSGKVKKVDAINFPIVGATAVAGTFTTLSATGTVTLDDGSGASPSFVMQDATDEAATFSKVDAGFLTITTVAGDGVNVLTGNLKIGNGTPGVTQDGEDAYIEGTLEADGAVQLDGALTVAGVSTLNGDVVGDGGDQMYGFLQEQEASTTAALTAAKCGKTIVSNSADVMTLPEASTVLGCRYTFVCGTADDLDINPADGTDVIGTIASITGTNTTTVLAPSAGDAVRCTDIGSSISIEAVAADLWVSVGNANGIWTDVN